ncbi:hypothetical protein EG68_05619 [Paragonimus skrjabini miyazakii]|uniref:Uncharacterized protein n=1 Tax=Paragonimus skrjabini miyazakii TaxID=59628 RepID=A0A8S9YUR2_9TREM|nr:hypothetical protein EG68_05619 [Paragonimus skrjabini miyazakii]
MTPEDGIGPVFLETTHASVAHAVYQEVRARLCLEMQNAETKQEDGADFLERIAMGEEHIYQTVYAATIADQLRSLSPVQPDQETQNHETDSDELAAKDDAKLCRNAWLLGVKHGAKLAAELCSCYGMVCELLHLSEDPAHRLNTSSSSSSSNHIKRDLTVLKIAKDLHKLLISCPGLLSLDANDVPVSVNFNQDTFEQSMASVRSKVKHLNSLLHLHLVDEAMSVLSF